MRVIGIKSIKIFTDGTISFYYIHKKFNKQVTFYEKDGLNLLFSKRPTKDQFPMKNIPRISYKSKYKF